MKQSYYNQKYFQERDHLDLHLAESIKILADNNHLKKILEIGCGTGRLVKFFNESGFETIGIDKADKAIKMARKINQKNSIIQASATNFPFKDNSFNLILAISLIEHLTPTESNRLFAESYRVLKPKGLIFLVTPNLNSPLRYLYGQGWFGYSDPTHKQFFTPKSLAKILKKKGFGNIKLQHKTAYNVKTELHLPGFCRPWPRTVKNFLNWLIISSPLATLRDSFWLTAQKK
jgi:ubiquinone/menaquinone biosynthesis C-methylase UbiE